jgi:hypothetical protein
MKNDPTFKFVAIVIIAGVILALAGPKVANGPRLTATTHAKVPAVAYHS